MIISLGVNHTVTVAKIWAGQNVEFIAIGQEILLNGKWVSENLKGDYMLKG